MKPLLRTFLAINAIIVMLFGLLFLLTPFWHYVDVLAPFASAPALIGQLLGVMLVGTSWLLANATINGAVTAPVARIAGHPIWVSGVVLLVWQIALHEPAVTGQPEWVVLGIGVVLVILGLGQARLGGAVRARERRQIIGARSAGRAEALARRSVRGGTDEPGIGAAAPMTPMASMTPESARVVPRGTTEPYIGTPFAAASRDPTGAPFAPPRDEGVTPVPTVATVPPVPPHSTVWTPTPVEGTDAADGVVKPRDVPPAL